MAYTGVPHKQKEVSQPPRTEPEDSLAEPYISPVLTLDGISSGMDHYSDFHSAFVFGLC